MKLFQTLEWVARTNPLTFSQDGIHTIPSWEKVNGSHHIHLSVHRINRSKQNFSVILDRTISAQAKLNAFVTVIINALSAARCTTYSHNYTLSKYMSNIYNRSVTLILLFNFIC